MRRLEDDFPDTRGTKRKLPNSEATRSFSERLAAVRKVAKREAQDVDADPADRSLLNSVNSSDKGELKNNADHLRKDESFRGLYCKEIDFAALARKDESLRPQYALPR
jgi:hypothetical protein